MEDRIMWISRKVWNSLTGDVHELKQWRTVYVAGLSVTKFKTCAACRVVFEPRLLGIYSYFYTQAYHKKNYSEIYCDHCAPLEAERQQVASWALEHPDKAKVCMDKHKESEK
jgi:hypothetical protein